MVHMIGMPSGNSYVLTVSIVQAKGYKDVQDWVAHGSPLDGSRKVVAKAIPIAEKIVKEKKKVVIKIKDAAPKESKPEARPSVEKKVSKAKQVKSKKDKTAK